MASTGRKSTLGSRSRSSSGPTAVGVRPIRRPPVDRAPKRRHWRVPLLPDEPAGGDVQPLAGGGAISSSLGDQAPVPGAQIDVLLGRAAVEQASHRRGADPGIAPDARGQPRAPLSVPGSRH